MSTHTLPKELEKECRKERERIVNTVCSRTDEFTPEERKEMLQALLLEEYGEGAVEAIVRGVTVPGSSRGEAS